MSRKTPILIISIWMLIFSMVISSIPMASTSATTKLSISPESVTGPPPDIGETFNINVTITNIISLTGWQIGLKWDPTVLRCNSFTPRFGTGTFLGPSGNWLGIEGTINNTIGEVYPPYGYSLITGRTPPNGSGTIAQVQFQVLDYGFTWIDLTNIMIESNRVSISVDLINGTFTLFAAPPAAPSASFTYSPSAPKFDQTVTFNASASEPGFNGTASVPIAKYTWDFGDGNVTVIGDDEPITPIITHVYPVNDTYTVNLTVTCEYDAMLDALGLLSDSTWQDVTITGPIHDVAVIDVTPSPTEVIAGETVMVSVTAENQGDFTETFTVTAYYDNTEIGTQTVLNLAPGYNEMLSLLWDTIDVDEDEYTIKAVASTVTGETDTADNTLIDGTVTVTAPATKLSIVPASIVGPPPDIGESFTVDIYITNVVNLTGWQIGLTWNASVLQCNSFTPQFGTGTFLGPQGNWIGIVGWIDNTAGEIFPSYAYSIVAGAPPNGSGTIAQVNFTVLDYGFTWINLPTTLHAQRSVMIESNRVPISVDLIDGTVAIFEISPAGPLASFTYSPSAPKVGERIEFDASASDPGWNGIASVLIANYTWDFGDGNVTTVTSPIIYHTYTAADTYTVNLTVTCEYDAVLDALGLLSDSTWQDVTTTAVAVHDVAVISVTASPTEVTAGETVTVNVTVENQGDFTETFTVTAYYDNTEIGTQTVTNLASGSTRTLTFTWNTTDVDEDEYTIKAVASTVTGETDTADNTRIDGTVTVTVEAPPSEIPWLWIILVIVIVVILIIVYMLMRRRKPK